MVIPKLGGQIDRTYNHPIVCLVNIYPGYTTYTFIEHGMVEVQYIVNVIVKLIYAQYTIIKCNVYIYNNV